MSRLFAAVTVVACLAALFTGEAWPGWVALVAFLLLTLEPETRIVWRSQTWPIKRQRRVYLLGRHVLSVPMRSVSWTRRYTEEEVKEWGEDV